MNRKTINLLDLMSEFYQQIALIKVWIRDQELNNQVMSILKQNTIPTNSETATAISLILNQWIELKRVKYQDVLTEREYQIFDRACFAMISLADELFIMLLPWPGKDHWHRVLLEEQSYQSCSSGVVFYKYVDELLNDKNFDALKGQLAAIYLLAMRLGFAGRYRDNDSKLNDYSKKLFSLLNREGKSSTELISIAAYQNNLNSQNEQRLAPLSNWYRGITYSLVAYGIVGVALWYSISWSLNQGMVG
jgi:type VI secretion system protein ImpK